MDNINIPREREREESRAVQILKAENIRCTIIHCNRSIESHERKRFSLRRGKHVENTSERKAER